MRRTNAGRKNTTRKVLLKLSCSLFWGEDAIVAAAAFFIFSSGASAHRAGIGRRRAVRVFAAAHRWKIVGVPDTKFCLRVGFSAPRGAGISLPFLLFLSHVRFAALRGARTFLSSFFRFFPEVILGSPGCRNLLFLSFRLLRSLTLCSRRDARSGPVYAFRRDAVGLMFRGFFV